MLKGKTSLVIVPGGPLWEMPFQALVTNANRFLIEDAAISCRRQAEVRRKTDWLMVEFHRQMKTKPAQGKAEALRQAALKVMKTEWHPYHWAPFVLG
jgi:CHAT domain-containing protein